MARSWPLSAPGRVSEPYEDLDMELAQARALVKDKTDKDITVRHLISVEGAARPDSEGFP